MIELIESIVLIDLIVLIDFIVSLDLLNLLDLNDWLVDWFEITNQLENRKRLVTPAFATVMAAIVGWTTPSCPVRSRAEDPLTGVGVAFFFPRPISRLCISSLRSNFGCAPADGTKRHLPICMLLGYSHHQSPDK